MTPPGVQVMLIILLLLQSSFYHFSKEETTKPFPSQQKNLLINMNFHRKQQSHNHIGQLFYYIVNFTWIYGNEYPQLL